MDSVTGREAERHLFGLIQDDCLDDVVLEYLLPNGLPLGWEGALWDYKKEVPITSGRGDDRQRIINQSHTLELVKDIVSFHNSFGGYILAGIDHLAIDFAVGCADLSKDGFSIEKLNEQVAAYTRKSIACKLRKVSWEGRQLALVLIPQRRDGDPVVSFIKGCPTGSQLKQPFSKGDIFARIEDRCLPIQNNLQGIQFVCSARIIHDTNRNMILENTLPIQDPDLIRFVGRSDYLLKLWSWLVDRHAPVKVLTALGGTGKTALAYEFARQFIASPPAWANKLVWLTAKKQAFSAIRGEWVKVTRTDFESVDELCGAIASELGASSDQINDAEDRSGLLDLVLESLDAFPAMVIIDDVDTLGIEDQADLFSAVQIIAGRSFAKGSRFLLTSRLELGAGDRQRIAVRGFEEQDFAEYIKMIAEERSIVLNDGVIRRLYLASLGSPTFSASILRLVTLGVDLNQAIRQWKGKEGEVVRRFAFARELEQLSDSETRALFALCALGETTQLELAQVLNVEELQLNADLAKLREYHMFAASGDPSTGAKLEAPEPIRLMADVMRTRITDPTRIENDCARARRHVPKQKGKSALSIASIIALWKANDYDGALLAAEQAKKQGAANADIHCMLGQCYLKVSPARAELADKAFRQAKTLGCRRPELIPNWLEAKQMKKDWVGIVDIYNTLPPSEFRGRSVTIVLMAQNAVATQQVERGDKSRGIESFKNVFLYGSAAIRHQRVGDQINEVRSHCKEAAGRYVQLVNQHNIRPSDRLDVFNAVIDAFQAHVTGTWMIELALTSIKAWASSAFGRKGDHQEERNILELRLIDLARLRLHLEDQPWKRDRLAELVGDAEHSLRKYLA